MYLREVPTLTLGQFADQVNDDSVAVQVAGSDIALVPDEQIIRLGANITVPATRQGLESLGKHVGVQPGFLFPSGDEQPDVEEQAYVLNRRLARLGNSVSIYYGTDGIRQAYKPGATPMNPRRVVEIATRVMGADAQIIESRFDGDSMHFDVSVPFDQVTTGDPTTLLVREGGQQVGDLTAAGLRFTQNIARNLTPTVDPFAFRLFCTNGMSLHDPVLNGRDSEYRVDARRIESVEEVLAALERRATEAFSRVEGHIQAFYDLRNQPIVGDPGVALARIGHERSLPDATITRITRDALPALLEQGESLTMFHLVNLLTNEANNPAINRLGTRRALEQAGGVIIGHNVERCTHCSSALN